MIYLFQKLTITDNFTCEELLVRQTVKSVEDPHKSFNLSDEWKLLGEGAGKIHLGFKTERYLPK